MKKITEKELDRITSTICSNITVEQKAMALYAFFEEYNMVNRTKAYVELDPIFTRRLNVLIEMYNRFNKSKMFDKKLKIYNTTIRTLYERLMNLNAMWCVINSDKPGIEKLRLMKKLYSSSTVLKKEFTRIQKVGIDDKMYSMARVALGDFDKIVETYEAFEKGEKKESLKIIVDPNEKYIQKYELARNAVSYYIESPDSYTDPIYFLARINMTCPKFESCLITIRRLNPDLYNEYLAKKEHDDEIRDQKFSEAIADLAQGIESGVLSDGTEFNKLEFIKRIPFKNCKKGAFVNDLSDFMSAYNLDDEGTIIDYIYDNEMNTTGYFNHLNIRYIYSVKTTVLDKNKKPRTITKEDNDIIFDYLYANNIPCIYVTYKIVRQKLIDGEITSEMAKENKKKHRHLLRMTLEKEELTE